MSSRARGGFEPAALRRWIPVGLAVAILVGGAAMVITRELISVSPTRREPPPAKAADEFVRFNDEAAAISISHPAAWTRVASPDPEVRLLAQGEGTSMQLRLGDIGTVIGSQELPEAKKLTDKLVRAAGQAKLVRPPRQVTLGGLPGYLYLYTFADAGGQRGAHAHYFLFRGRTLITIVFQTVPAERLTQLAPLFDKIGETLRTTPG